MKWSRELRIARRSLRTALRAASAITTAKLPSARLLHWPETSATRASADLLQVSEFGSNPGRLDMFVYLPSESLMEGAPLVVLLHGCGQTAAAFGHDTGWIALADELGFPLVLPEQSGDNNGGRCFNWFRPTQTGRGLGEALSIRQMVETAIRRFDTEPSRVFIAGLSAGGAMAAALMAAYPDVFAAGAVVAGLPVGAASGVSDALRRMAEAGPEQSPAVWAEQVHHAAPIGYRGPWPRLSIWHGEADRVVDPANARLLAAQWSALHGLGPTANDVTDFKLARRERWTLNQQSIVERWSLPELGHDWPPAATEAIAEFWDLVD
jgi:poly(hydroxyalkanoate) depolymerase family esterase